MICLKVITAIASVYKRAIDSVSVNPRNKYYRVWRRVALSDTRSDKAVGLGLARRCCTSATSPFPAHHTFPLTPPHRPNLDTLTLSIPARSLVARLAPSSVPTFSRPSRLPRPASQPASSLEPLVRRASLGLSLTTTALDCVPCLLLRLSQPCLDCRTERSQHSLSPGVSRLSSLAVVSFTLLRCSACLADLCFLPRAADSRDRPATPSSSTTQTSKLL